MAIIVSVRLVSIWQVLKEQLRSHECWEADCPLSTQAERNLLGSARHALTVRTTGRKHGAYALLVDAPRRAAESLQHMSRLLKYVLRPALREVGHHGAQMTLQLSPQGVSDAVCVGLRHSAEMVLHATEQITPGNLKKLSACQSARDTYVHLHGHAHARLCRVLCGAELILAACRELEARLDHGSERLHRSGHAAH
mgnify:CR=1 FL=1|jgi:hypothetical protein